MVSQLLTTLILAQQAPVPPVVTETPWYMAWYGLLGIVVLVVLLSVAFGTWIAPLLRMQDSSWKFTLVALALLSALALMWLRWPPKFGIDLQGGTILAYELDKEDRNAALASGGNPEELMKRLIAAISKRVDPAGVKQVQLRSIGGDAIEVVVPEVDPTEVAMLKKILQTTGHLEFRILADPRVDQAIIERARRSDWKVEDPNVDARRDSDDQKTEYLIELAEDMEQERLSAKPGEKPAVVPTIVILAGRPGAQWIDVPEKDAAAARADKQLVTRTVDGKTQKLVVLGEVQARWFQIGKDEKGRSRVDSLDRNVVSRPSRRGEGFDVLVLMDSQNVEGKYLKSARSSVGTGLQNEVLFEFNSDGARLFGDLTGANVPKGSLVRKLGILLDDELLSAPNLNDRISERGQITGNFSRAEVDWLVGVLDAGSLPAKLNPTPISEMQASATLGAETIRQGATAILISLVIVPLAMVAYYRFAGFVAGIAVLLNLVLVVGVMVGVQAAFTLAGIAGLVLTVGMAVDANVLIYERIREELDRGAALRMAIRNGFSRATRTIVDSNATNIITAVVLYTVGTEQLKGFAITLILGILMSMFTAIFCARLVFDVCEKNRWITTLRMTRLMGQTNINFVGAIRYCVAASIILIAIGMGAVYMRGADFLDIDFRGGTKIEIVFRQPHEQSKVEGRLREFSEKAPTGQKLDAVTAVGVGEGKTDFNVETVQADIKVVKAGIRDTFKDELKTNVLSFNSDQVQKISVPRSGALGSQSEEPATKAPAESPADEEAAKESVPGVPGPNDAENGAKGGQPAEGKPAEGDGAQLSPGAARTLISAFHPQVLLLAQVEGNGPDSQAVSQPTDPPAEPSGADVAPAVQGTQAPATTQPAAQATDAPVTEFSVPAEVDPNPFAGGTRAPLTFEDKIKQDVLKEMIRQAGQRAGFVKASEEGIPKSEAAAADEEAPVDLNFQFRLINPQVIGESQVPQTQWLLETTLGREDTLKLLGELQAVLAGEPVFPMATNVGGQVAGNMQLTAFSAIFISFVAIVGYLWIRFQHVRYGLAAVVALIHDVAVTVGILALTEYFKMIPYMEGFKMNLVILAALLTLIGYSLNDTIVIFDRIRELRGKSPHINRDLVNLAVNQTLSRTLLTSVFTFVVVGVLFFVGGPGVHGFSFTLLIGIIVGTYSSIYIAAPVLLWMEERATGDAKKPRDAERKAAPTAG